MDLDDFRSIVGNSGVDVWTFIDTAIQVASLDYEHELKNRRDGIVEKLYASSIVNQCRNCDFKVNGHGNGELVKSPFDDQRKKVEVVKSPVRSVDDGEEDEELDPFAGLFDDEQKNILEIKEQLEDPDQNEDSLIGLLQTLADMDITFKALQETDIGRHVNRLRKHSSENVKKLVKRLVRKWKETVDEWVKLNQPGQLESSTLIADGDSPQQNTAHRNYQEQIPDFAYSPNPNYGGSGSDKNHSEVERKPKPVPRRDAPSSVRPNQSLTTPNVQRQREQKDANFDSQRLASARKRLQESYKEAENAKKQRTIRVMEIHDIPKSKNTFFAKNKGSGGSGGGSHGRHW